MTALLIDLDDTLIDDRGATAAAVLGFRRKHRLATNESDDALTARWDAATRAVWRRLVLGEITFQQQRRIRLREVFSLTLTDDQADALFTDYLHFYERAWSLLPGTVEFLDATSHMPRIIVTNGHRPQALQKLAKFGLEDHFQGVVTPDDCGVRKPNPGIFLHALNLIGADSSDALMIGDDLDADIQPALALGMKAFHVNPSEPGRSIRDAADTANDSFKPMPLHNTL